MGFIQHLYRVGLYGRRTGSLSKSLANCGDQHHPQRGCNAYKEHTESSKNNRGNDYEIHAPGIQQLAGQRLENYQDNRKDGKENGYIRDGAFAGKNIKICGNKAVCRAEQRCQQHEPDKPYGKNVIEFQRFFLSAGFRRIIWQDCHTDHRGKGRNGRAGKHRSIAYAVPQPQPNGRTRRLHKGNYQAEIPKPLAHPAFGNIAAGVGNGEHIGEREENPGNCPKEQQGDKASGKGVEAQTDGISCFRDYQQLFLVYPVGEDSGHGAHKHSYQGQDS